MSKTIVIRDVELNWANVFVAKSPFGAMQWDIQVKTTDPKKAEEMKAAGINIKNKDGAFVANIKRKTVSAKGTPNEAPKVLLNKAEWPTGKVIGNGSTGDVKVFSYDYNVAGRSGTSAMLSAVNVTNLVEYEGSDNEDF